MKLFLMSALAGTMLMGACSDPFDNRSDLWKLQIVDDTYKATGDMYACASETWEVENGPKCKKACQEYADLRQRELHPPPYVKDFKDIIEDASGSSVCKNADKPPRVRKW